MASGSLIAAHDNVFNRQVLEENALYFSNPEDIAGLMDRLPCASDVAELKKRNLEKIIQRYRWPDIITKYERFMLYCLSMKKSNARNILYRRYSG
jgi:hypothetical protein